MFFRLYHEEKTARHRLCGISCSCIIEDVLLEHLKNDDVEQIACGKEEARENADSFAPAFDQHGIRHRDLYPVQRHSRGFV